MQNFDLTKLKWINRPSYSEIGTDHIKIVTDPKTDFWQKTAYGFQNDNGHILYLPITDTYFTLSAKVEFEYNGLFDQCGIAIYQGSDTWMKCCIEYHNEYDSWLGSVVTNSGYSDWATRDIKSSCRQIWYRLSRRNGDFRLEYSCDGVVFEQMRTFHLLGSDVSVNVGFMACSPKDSSLTAVFSEITYRECIWELES